MRAYDAVIDFIGRRRTAYCTVFMSDDKRIGPRALEVLTDLARFCRADRTCFHADPRVHAAMEGRREVWLRIQENLHLTDEQLAQIYAPNHQVTTTKEKSDE